MGNFHFVKWKLAKSDFPESISDSVSNVRFSRGIDLTMCSSRMEAERGVDTMVMDKSFSRQSDHSGRNLFRVIIWIKWMAAVDKLVSAAS